MSTIVPRLKAVDGFSVHQVADMGVASLCLERAFSGGGARQVRKPVELNERALLRAVRSLRVIRCFGSRTTRGMSPSNRYPCLPHMANGKLRRHHPGRNSLLGFHQATGKGEAKY